MVASSTSDSLGAFALTVMLLGSTACSKQDPGGDTAGTTTTTSMTTSESGQEGSTETDTNDSANDTAITSMSFYAHPADVGPPDDCDPFLQDCPDGEKCVPYSTTGGLWDANKCVVITGSGQPGEPCIYGGTIEATDDCGAESHCWNALDVDGVAMGVCTEFCQGSLAEPMCSMGTVCMIAYQESVSLCVEPCNPVVQDCGPGLACYWADSTLSCMPTTQDVPLGELCGFINDCAAGLGCMAAELLPNCAGDACCASFCSLAAPVCPQVGTECSAFFEQGMAPQGYEDVGICILPAP